MDKEVRPDHRHDQTQQVEGDHHSNHHVFPIHPHNHRQDRLNSDKGDVVHDGDDESDTQSDDDVTSQPANIDTRSSLQQLGHDTALLKEYTATKEEDPQEQRCSVMCLSPPQSLRKLNLELPRLTSRRCSVGNGRRPSMKTGPGAETTEDISGMDSQEAVHREDTAFIQMSLTEKRLAMLKDRFSSKNLFNVKRQNTAYFADGFHSRPDHSPDGLRKAMSGMTLSQQRSVSSGMGRPVTSYSTLKGRHVGRLLPRAATSSGHRPGRNGNQHFLRMHDAFMELRQPRSRRELEKLSQMRVDPFQVDLLEEDRAEQWAPLGDVHQDLLERLRRHRPMLQQRVSNFLKDLENFNRRGHRTGLEQILDIT